ncbi:MAG TPA: hypothetical protein VJX72_15690 [Candidatus Acidoferrum sp.]|nr:hypothetical protein [Candidatus Acidoferrum sp.]
MDGTSIFGWVIQCLLLAGCGWWCFIEIRYLKRRAASKRWPNVTATIQKGAVGRISFGRGASAPACFLGYAYLVEGTRRAGFFALYGEEGKVDEVQKRLASSPLDIRYDPSNPDLSCMIDFYDSRFEGLAATQNPQWLDQAPAFDLADALGSATNASPLETRHSDEQSHDINEKIFPAPGAIVESGHSKIRILWTCAVLYFAAMLVAFQFAGRVPYQVLTLAGIANMAILISFVVLLKRAYKPKA